MDKEMDKIERIIQILSTITNYTDDEKQDIFLKIIEKVNLDNYPQQTLLNLVRKMLKNQKLDNIKKERMNYIDLDVSQIEFMTLLPTEDYVDIEEKMKVLKIALKSLNKNEQEIFFEILSGNKNKLIAKKMGINVNNLKSIKKRGIEKLKKIMNGKIYKHKVDTL